MSETKMTTFCNAMLRNLELTSKSALADIRGWRIAGSPNSSGRNKATGLFSKHPAPVLLAHLVGDAGP
jgi:hypothetical protein